MIEQVSETAKLIAEQGIMVVICAFFLIGSIITQISNYKSQKRDREELRRIFETLISDNKKMMEDLMSETREQNSMLYMISEGMRPETREKLRAVIEAYFDLAVEKAVQILKRVRRENGIANHEVTHQKFTRLLTTLHRKRRGDFSHFTWSGEPISKAIDPQWVEQVRDVLEHELYHPEENESRTYTNIKNIYDTIKTDYYERLGLE